MFDWPLIFVSLLAIGVAVFLIYFLWVSIQVIPKTTALTARIATISIQKINCMAMSSSMVNKNLTKRFIHAE